MKIRTFLLSSILGLCLIGQASAKIVTTEHVFPHELLYIMIGVLSLLFALIIWESKTTTKDVKRNLNLEYLLRLIMGVMSLLLAFLLSKILSSESIIYATASETWSVASDWLSIFFLVWGILMCVYTGGMLIKFFNERSAEAEQAINNGGNRKRR